MSNTYKVAKSLRSKLLKLNAGFWRLFEVDGKVFTNNQEATAYARRLAKVTGDQFSDIYEVKVPKALPHKYLTGAGYRDTPIMSEPPKRLFFAGGKIHEDYTDAKNTARKDANATGEMSFIHMATINMAELDMITGFSPEQKPEYIVVKRTDAPAAAVEAGAA